MTFVDTVFLIFVGKAFVTIVDAVSVTFTISSDTITEMSAILFRYLPFWQI